MAKSPTKSATTNASRKQMLAAQKAKIEAQKTLIKNKQKDLHQFNKRVKNTKGITMTAKMQNAQIANAKQQDIYRCKQTLDRLMIAYSKAYHNK